MGLEQPLMQLLHHMILDLGISKELVMVQQQVVGDSFILGIKDLVRAILQLVVVRMECILLFQELLLRHT